MKFSQEKTWYEDISARYQPRFKPLEGDSSCDVCIVGGGITSVIAALELAEAGRKVIVLEASELSYGSTGRSGVPLFTGFKSDYNEIVKAVGEEDLIKMWEQTIHSREAIVDRIKKHNINCAYTPGLYFGGQGPLHRKALKRRTEYAAKHFGELDPTNFLSGTKFHEEIECEGFSSALYQKKGGSLNLVQFLYDLIRVAEEKGVIFHEDTKTTGFEFGVPNTVKTPYGEVSCEYLLICGNAFMPEFSTPDKTASVSTTYYQWVSKPLAANLAAELSPGREAVFDMTVLPQYFQITIDNRIVLGAPDHYFDMNPHVVANKIKNRVRRLFPKAMNVKTDYLWRGRIGMSTNVLPVFEHNGEKALVVHGISGHGMVVAYMCGQLLAQAVQGRDEGVKLFEHLKVPKTSKWVYLASTWFKIMKYKWQDLVLDTIHKMLK